MSDVTKFEQTGSCNFHVQESHPINERETIEKFIQNKEVKFPPGPAKLGYFGDDTSKNADSVCVLVAHYVFEDVPRDVLDDVNEGADIFRGGDAEDVQNLRKTYEENRKCRFREWISPTREDILDLLSSKDKLLTSFGFKSEDCVPSVFILYILSHGYLNGVIYTDHFVRRGKWEIITFTTEEVFSALKQLEGFQSCLKWVNFGPCRGAIRDTFLSNESEDHLFDENKNSCRLTFSPIEKNFAVLYSTVETTQAIRSPDHGTRLVINMCKVLNKLESDLPLVEVLTKVQNSIMRESLIRGPGQTPEFKILPADSTFTICRRDQNSQRGAEEEDNIDVANRAVCKFPWEISDTALRGREARILCNNDSDEGVKNVEVVLKQNLGFACTSFKLTNENLQAFYSHVNSDDHYDIGCYLTCIFAMITENYQGEICVTIEEEEIPLREIVYQFLGPKNKNWIGKPKIFIVIQQRPTVEDGQGFLPKTRPTIPATYHSGWLVLVLPDENSAADLINVFQSIELKNGTSLQKLFYQLVVKSNRALLDSTLEYLLEFPDFPRHFVPPNFTVTAIEDGTLARAKDELSFEEFVDKFTNDKKHCIWMLRSDPGTGKSTVVREIAHQISKQLRYVWKINIYNYFKGRQQEESAFVFLSNHVPFTAEEIEHIFNHDRPVVFLDGLDEVWRTFGLKLLQLIRKLMCLNVTLWIVSRSQEGEEIWQSLKEETENAQLVEMKQLSRDQQIKLLQLLKQHKSEEECKKLLGEYEELGLLDILGNPLHLTLASQVNKMTNLFKVFDNIVNLKIGSAMKDTKECSEENGRAFVETIKERKEILNDMAWSSLNGESVKLSESDEKQALRTGITFKVGGNIKFVQQIFAEFHALLKFISDLKEGGGETEVDVFAQDRQQCRMFLDEWLSVKKDVEKETWENVVDHVKGICSIEILKTRIVAEDALNLFEAVSQSDYFELQDLIGKGIVDVALNKGQKIMAKLLEFEEVQSIKNSVL